MLRIFLTLTWGCVSLVSMATAGLEWKAKSVELVAPFGKETLTIPFPFKVTGDSPVTLKNVRSNCECLAATPGRKTYQPGEEGAVEAIFTIGERQGRSQSIIAVDTDEKEGGEHRLKLVVKIRKEVEFSKRFLRWKKGGSGGSPQTVGVKLHPESKRKITGARSLDKNFTAKLEPSENTGEFTLTVTPINLEGTNRGIIFLKTDPEPFNPKAFGIFLYVR